MGFIDLRMYLLEILAGAPIAPRAAGANSASCSSGSGSGTAEANHERPDTTRRIQEPCTDALQAGEPSQRLTAESIRSR